MSILDLLLERVLSLAWGRRSNAAVDLPSEVPAVKRSWLDDVSPGLQAEFDKMPDLVRDENGDRCWPDELGTPLQKDLNPIG
jgi:hypothetical protein